MRTLSFGLIYKWRNDELVAKAIYDRIESRRNNKIMSFEDPLNKRDPISLSQLQAAFFIYVTGNFLALVTISYDFIDNYFRKSIQKQD